MNSNFLQVNFFFDIPIEHCYDKIKFVFNLFAKPFYNFRNAFLGMIGIKMIPNIILQSPFFGLL